MDKKIKSRAKLEISLHSFSKYHARYLFNISSLNSIHFPFLRNKCTNWVADSSQIRLFVLRVSAYRLFILLGPFQNLQFLSEPLFHSHRTHCPTTFLLRRSLVVVCWFLRGQTQIFRFRKSKGNHRISGTGKRLLGFLMVSGWRRALSSLRGLLVFWCPRFPTHKMLEH